MTTTNQAFTVLERMGINLRNQVTLTINSVDFSFKLDQAAYDECVNSITENNRLTPLKDYLIAIVSPEQREEFLEIINIPNMAISIAEKVNKELFPKIEITVKN